MKETLSKEYELAMENFRNVSAKFRQAQLDYRAKRIGDAEFLTARAAYDEAGRISDEAEMALRKEMNL